MNKVFGTFAFGVAIALSVSALVACGDDSSTSPETNSCDLKDSRDGQCYKTVKIGDQTWMAENLNYAMEPDSEKKSVCLDDKPDNCEKYGRLYTWEAAQDACPSGWILPDTKAVTTLFETVGGKQSDDPDNSTVWLGAGKALKSTSGWTDLDGNAGNGSDDYGFTALPAGYHLLEYGDEGYGASFWTSDEGHQAGVSYALNAASNDASIVKRYPPAAPGTLMEYAVRCVKNP